MKATVYGGHKLKEISVEPSGYKHASSMVILAALAGEIPCRISNVPNILDTICLTKIISQLGCNISFAGQDLSLYSFSYNKNTIDEEDAIQIHNTLYLLPVLGFKMPSFFLPSTGGCAIGNGANGERPTSHILDLMCRSGAVCEETNKGIKVRAPKKIIPLNVDIMDYSTFSDRLAGPLVSGATKVALFIAMQCFEESVIRNPYLKGDVISILEFLSASGFYVSYDKDSIHLSRCARKNKPHYTIISDPTEIITYMCLSIYCNFPVKMTNISPVSVQRELDMDLEFLKAMGIRMNLDKNNTLTFLKGTENEKGPSRLEIFSGAHQILSDHQPFYALLMSQTPYGGTVSDYVWKKRFSYAEELNKMVHAFDFSINQLIVRPGVEHSKKVEVFGKDLRSTAVLLIAALRREAITVVHGLEHLTRGYNRFLENLCAAGAHIQ